VKFVVGLDASHSAEAKGCYDPAEQNVAPHGNRGPEDFIFSSDWPSETGRNQLLARKG